MPLQQPVDGPLNAVIGRNAIHHEGRPILIVSLDQIIRVDPAENVQLAFQKCEMRRYRAVKPVVDIQNHRIGAGGLGGTLLPIRAGHAVSWKDF